DRGGIIRLAVHSLLLFGAGGSESSTGFRLVFCHPCDQSFAEVPPQLDGIVAEKVVAQRFESRFGCCDIALRQGTEEPGIGDTLKCLRIFGADLIQRLMQGSCISLPVQWNQGADYFRFDIIWLDRQRAVENRSFL